MFRFRCFFAFSFAAGLLELCVGSIVRTCERPAWLRRMERRRAQAVLEVVTLVPLTTPAATVAFPLTRRWRYWSPSPSVSQQPNAFNAGEVCSGRVRDRGILTHFCERSIISWELEGCLRTLWAATFLLGRGQSNLFIHYIQVKHQLREAGIICSLSSVGKQLTSNAD